VSRQQKIALGILTGVMALGPLLVLPSLFLNVPTVYVFVPLMVLNIGLVVFYIWFLADTDSADLLGQVRWPWVLLVIFGGSVGQIVVWYLNIWRTPSLPNAQQALQPCAPDVGIESSTDLRAG
jgi:hypothetical protein